MPPVRRAKVRKDPLSADDRKQNHVNSEKKRREAIRKGFDRITAVVPELDATQSRSEATVLEKTVEMLTKLMEENKQLRGLARINGVAPELPSNERAEPVAESANSGV